MPFDWHLIPVSLDEEQISDTDPIPPQIPQATGEISAQGNSDFTDPESLQEEHQLQRRNSRFQQLFRSFSLSTIVGSSAPPNYQQEMQRNPEISWWRNLTQWFVSWTGSAWLNPHQPSSDSHQ